MAGARGGRAGGSGQVNPPTPPLSIFSKVVAIYDILSLPANLHDLLDNYMKILPKFIGEGDLTATKHMAFFDQFAYILGIEFEDVYMRLFVQNFEGQVRTWFRGLPADSITTYDELETTFLRQWGEKKDHLNYLTQFGALRNNPSETVFEFIQRFNNLYSKIPAEVNPSQPAAKFTFVGALDFDFSLLLRERRAATLTEMQDNVIDIESSMMA
jgi:hypothetical protein